MFVPVVDAVRAVLPLPTGFTADEGATEPTLPKPRRLYVWPRRLAPQRVEEADGRFDEAIAHYEAALQLRPDFADAHFNLATALAQLRRWPEAAAHYEAVLKLRPDYPRARENLATVRALQSRGG